ncbi:MAG: class F sortase [Patescibacteria group bacterium]
MERKSRISLDNPAFRGRLRIPRDAVRHTSTPVQTAKASTATYARQPIASQQTIGPAKVTQTVTAPVLSYPRLPRQSRTSVLNRQLLPAKVSHKKSRWRSHMPKVLTSMAVMLFIGGILIFVSSIRTDQTVKAQVKQLSSQAENSEDGVTDAVPSEDDPPANVGAYSVAKDLPRLLTIEKIGLSARVRRVGIGPNNTMKAPASIFDAGWYEGGAKPGENGTVVLDGHVSGPTKRGVFYGLKTLQAGDKIKLERGDGEIFSYTVVELETIDEDKVDMSKVLTSSVAGKPGLNLITCSGKFNAATNQYAQRTVAYSVQD